MPQVWKSLAVDYQVPVSFPLSVTVEGIYTKTMNGVMLKNYNLNNQMLHGIVFLVLMTGIFIPKPILLILKNAYVLSNTTKGFSAIGNITVNAEPIENLKLMAAYTYTESQEISGMPGSNAICIYRISYS
jgi:hypothetical protein